MSYLQLSLIAGALAACEAGQTPGAAAWTNPSLAADVRAADMTSRMTIPEKAACLSQRVAPFNMSDGSGLVAQIYNAECLHGPAAQRSFSSTVYPSPIAQAASFNPELVRSIGKA